MPSLFRLFGYVVFFWSNEGNPLEPVHVHVAKGTPNANATKIWITEAGGTLLANNNSQIPQRTLSWKLLKAALRILSPAGMISLAKPASTSE